MCACLISFQVIQHVHQFKSYPCAGKSGDNYPGLPKLQFDSSSKDQGQVSLSVGYLKRLSVLAVLSFGKIIGRQLTISSVHLNPQFKVQILLVKRGIDYLGMYLGNNLQNATDSFEPIIPHGSLPDLSLFQPAVYSARGVGRLLLVPSWIRFRLGIRRL